MLSKDVHWSILQVRLSSMDEKVALVPWADMLNHSPEVPDFLLQRAILNSAKILLKHPYPQIFFPSCILKSLPNITMLLKFTS